MRFDPRKPYGRTAVQQVTRTPSRGFVLVALVLLLAAMTVPAVAHDPDFTTEFDRAGCSFTSVGNNTYFPLWPGQVLLLEGEEEDDEGEMVSISAEISTLDETELVDGVVTRVVVEREEEDGELVEISRNFFAICRETGDVWYFGEDVDDYEDGEIVGHGGAWRAGVDGATPGVLMPGSPLVGARFFQEMAAGVAEDRSEIVALDQTVEVPAGSFPGSLYAVDSDALDPASMNDKFYAPGIGLIVDDELELVDYTPPPCQPDATTHCLNNGRFRVEVEWEDFGGNMGDGTAILPTDLSGEFWFFNPNNTEVLVKVLNGCNLPSNAYWVFAAGLTNVGVTLTVTDTVANVEKIYENPVRNDFEPILDTGAFDTCP